MLRALASYVENLSLKADVPWDSFGHLLGPGNAPNLSVLRVFLAKESQRSLTNLIVGMEERAQAGRPLSRLEIVHSEGNPQHISEKLKTHVAEVCVR